MKTIGIIGGMSPQSTIEYYRIINELVNAELGGQSSAKVNIVSVEFGELARLQHENDWDSISEILCKYARKVEASGADILLIATNTMHKCFNEIHDSVNIPILHVGDALGEVLTAKNNNKLLLLGTKFTMEQSFYKDYLIDTYGLDIIVPNQEDINIVHEIIYNELCHGIINPASRDKYLKIIDSYLKEKIDGVILGCTEIGLLINQKELIIPIFDTTYIHAKKAVQMAIHY